MQQTFRLFFLKRRYSSFAPCTLAGEWCRSFGLFLLFLFPLALYGQEVQLSGQVADREGGVLPLANILVLPDSIVVPADLEGEFAVKVRPGEKSLRITYTGYQPHFASVLLQKDTSMVFILKPATEQLLEVAVTANPYSQENLVNSARTGTTTLSRKEISAIPALGGETDVIKTLQLLPGTTKGVQGSSDLFVRGGAADQNLILLDGTPVYNTSHLFGFLSVFNADVLEKVEAVTGGFSAEYGGRLSSILDITSRNNIAPETNVSGNVGLISSRLFVAQPLIKNKLGIWLAGRRTYIDKVVELTGEKLPYYFYDLNGKITFRPTEQDQFSISYFGGRDHLDLSEEEGEGFGFTSTYVARNNSQTLQWQHWSQGNWQTELSLFHSSFGYDIINIFEEDQLKAFSSIEDYGAKFTFRKETGWKEGELKSGIEWTRHRLSPNVVSSTGLFSDYLESSLSQEVIALEMAGFIQQEWQLTSKWLINAGIRGSLALAENENYFVPEPRLSVRYALKEGEALKFSYSRMAQYMHRISSSAISTPTDIWYTVTDSIQPQKAHQWALVWQKFLNKPKVLLSAGAYFKSMQNLIGFEEGASLLLNTDFESQLIQGKGRAYGVELLMRKEAGKLSGWLSYTLAWAWRQYPGIIEGEWFPARYDRRHNGALVMQYAFHDRWSASMVWEYMSGSRFTPVIGQYVVLSPVVSGVDLIPEYSEINAVKLSDTHRLDLGVRYRSKADKRFRWDLFVGVNNVYNRASPIGIFIEQDEEDGSLHYTQPGLFGLLPFINFGFSF